MLKSKMIINVLFVLIISICLQSIDNLIAGDCAEKKNGGEVQTVSGDYYYTDNWLPKIQFDPGNPDETARNSSVNLNVIGGCSPYTWSVSGTGFNLAESQTTGLSNTLIADESACGTATITVTGCVGPSATGYVRCTTGSWIYKGLLCGSSPPSLICGPTVSCYVITGNKRRFYCKTCLCSDNCHTCEAYFVESEACPPYSGYPGYCEDWGDGGPACGPCRGTPPGTGKAGVAHVKEWEWSCP